MVLAVVKVLEAMIDGTAPGLRTGEYMTDVRAIDIGDKVHPQGRITERFQSLTDHFRA